MAAKRLFDDSDNDPDLPNQNQNQNQNQKRIKTTKTTFASVIKEAVTRNFLENFCATLEPMLRKVVHEEVENGLRRNLRSLTKVPSMRIHAIDELPSLQLIFAKKLSLPIFTGSKVTDIEGNHLQILLVDTRDDAKIPTSLPYPVKIEIMVLDGDFPSGDLDKWSCEEFDKNILKERTGKRPLLAGELSVTMRDGFCSIGDIEFTDNSSWIRSRRFRLGAKVVHQGTNGEVVRIRPAMTDQSFVVKDHRGELYKKHYPPALEDEVWRLEKIGKDGAFHRKLSGEGINTVQDFLKLSVVDSLKLRKILGIGMSEKMWDVTLKHASTCEKGTKFYISRGSNHVIILNSVCQVIKAVTDGHVYDIRNLSLMHKGYIEKLVKQAYANWTNLEEVDGQVNETALLTMGEYVHEYPNQQGGHLRDGSSMNNNDQQMDHYNDEWGGVVNCSYIFNTPIQESSGRYFSESSSG